MKLLLFEDRILKLEEGVPSEEVTYDRPYPGDRLVLSLTNAALDELSIRALRPEEMVELQRLKPNFEGSSTERLGPLPDEEIPDSPLHLCL